MGLASDQLVRCVRGDQSQPGIVCSKSTLPPPSMVSATHAPVALPGVQPPPPPRAAAAVAAAPAPPLPAAAASSLDSRVNTRSWNSIIGIASALRRMVSEGAAHHLGGPDSVMHDLMRCPLVPLDVSIFKVAGSTCVVVASPRNLPR